MKDERFFWGDLHPVCVLRGLLYNLWVLILAVLTAWLCVEGYHLFTYHPVYTASATVAVNVKGGTSAYTSRSHGPHGAGVCECVSKRYVPRGRAV